MEECLENLRFEEHLKLLVTGRATFTYERALAKGYNSVQEYYSDLKRMSDEGQTEGDSTVKLRQKYYM